MDLLQRLGGRKFLMALIVLGIGTYIEITKQAGLSQNMVALMVGLVGVFSAANHMTTSAFLKSKPSRNGLDLDVSSKMDSILENVQAINNPEATERAINVLVDSQKKIEQVQQTSLQLGQTMIGLSKEVASIKAIVKGGNY